MSRQTSTLAAALLSFGLLSLGLPAVAGAGGDANAGKEKSLACQACHAGPPGAGDTPHLAGQREAYLVKQLKAFKAGDRKNPFMSAIAGQLGDADIDNLAAFWSSQATGSDSAVPEAALAIKKSHMVFPKDFPKGFTLYLTANNAEKNVVSKTYVNAIGFQAVKAGKQMPDGSVIVVVNSAAKLDADKKPVVEKDGSWAIEKIAGYTGMEARAGWGRDIPELLRNANWNYGVFTADQQPRAEVAQTICLACHKPKAAESFLFSFKELHEKTGAR
jgi:cytochrome c553